MSKNTSFVAYVDESGCEGFRFGEGSSDWLVLSAVVVRKKIDPLLVKSIVDATRADLVAAGQTKWVGSKKLKFSKLKPQYRHMLVNRIAASPLRLMSVLVHKPSLTEPETFQAPSRLYFYACRYLIERLSWFCRDHRLDGEGDGTVEIIFDERATMLYADMKAYLEVLETKETAIEWKVVRPSLVSSRKGTRFVGLQVADAVAGSFFCAVDSANGQGDHCFAESLRPVVYRTKKKCLGYGIKPFPGHGNCADFFGKW